MFENRALKKIFVPKRYEVTKEWRRLRNEELCGLYSSPNIIGGDKIEKNEIGGACSTQGGEKRCIQCFGGET